MAGSGGTIAQKEIVNVSAVEDQVDDWEEDHEGEEGSFLALFVLLFLFGVDGVNFRILDVILCRLAIISLFIVTLGCLLRHLVRLITDLASVRAA
jgi:hypothetical protein